MKIIALLVVVVLCTGSTRGRRSKTNPYLNLPGLRHAALSTENDHRLAEDDSDYDEEIKGKTPFLRVTAPMKDQNAISGDKIQFRCKVEGWPNRNLTYTWYKDDLVLDPMYDHRLSITSRSWGSRLRMIDVYTLDSGRYRCEASNGWRRVETVATLTVSFKTPPPLKDNEKPTLKMPTGHCEKYSGFVCAKYFRGMSVFVDPFQYQSEMNNQIKMALSKISNPSKFSQRCQRFLLPAFCHFVFPQCNASSDGQKASPGARLCREDCELLKSDTCRNEYLRKDNDVFIKELFNTADCSKLPSVTENQCVRIGIPDPESREQRYHGNGVNYRGTISVAESGRTCQAWPKRMAKKHPELLGGHNFCRNPDGESSRPWCFTDASFSKKEHCKIEQCDDGNEVNFLYIAIPCACVVFLFIGISILCCAFRRRRTRVQKACHQPSNGKAKVILLQKANDIPRMQRSCVRLMDEVGNWEGGKTFNGEIVGDPRFEDGYPVAVKMLDDHVTSSQRDAFMREIDLLSELQHPNIASLKAVVLESNCRWMLFENADQVALQHHLMSHCGQTRNANLLDVATQIAWAAEHWCERGFVYKDLAARNVFVTPDATVQVSLLGFVPSASRPGYQQSPPSPIRWMSPESLLSRRFTTKSDVYSFGILLWEMYSDFLEPYCGHTNQEALDMITRGELLSCPDQCPAKVYSLMRECWAAQPMQRPTFKEISAKLNTWKLEKPPMFDTTQLLCSDIRHAPTPPPEYSSLAIDVKCAWATSSGPLEYLHSNRNFSKQQLTSRDDQLDEDLPFNQEQAQSELVADNLAGKVAIVEI